MILFLVIFLNICHVLHCSFSSLGCGFLCIFLFIVFLYIRYNPTGSSSVSTSSINISNTNQLQGNGVIYHPPIKSNGPIIGIPEIWRLIPRFLFLKFITARIIPKEKPYPPKRSRMLPNIQRMISILFFPIYLIHC